MLDLTKFARLSFLSNGKAAGADPVVLLTDALNLALVGGSGESSPGKF
jgi:hypothetical protein